MEFPTYFNFKKRIVVVTIIQGNTVFEICVAKKTKQIRFPLNHLSLKILSKIQTLQKSQKCDNKKIGINLTFWVSSMKTPQAELHYCCCCWKGLKHKQIHKFDNKKCHGQCCFLLSLVCSALLIFCCFLDA